MGLLKGGRDRFGGDRSIQAANRKFAWAKIRDYENWPLYTVPFIYIQVRLYTKRIVFSPLSGLKCSPFAACHLESDFSCGG